LKTNDSLNVIFCFFKLNAKLDGDDIRILDAVFSDQNLIEG